jgi:hypothetical protein
MNSINKLILKIIMGKSDNNIKFSDLYNLLIKLGFELRTNGSHPIFRKEGINMKLNLQRDGDMAKFYQVKQVRYMLIKYKLGDVDEL